MRGSGTLRNMQYVGRKKLREQERRPGPGKLLLLPLPTEAQRGVDVACKTLQGIAVIAAALWVRLRRAPTCVTVPPSG